jgi:hypothetical protein
MLGLLGVVLLVQGVGGLINRLSHSESKGWFFQLYILPDGAHVAASIVVAVAGAAIFAYDTVQRKKARN